MTISKGESWGVTVPRPDDLRIAADDAELARMLSDNTAQPTAVSSGDMYATIGARPIGSRDEVLKLPIDVIRVTIGSGSPREAVAHVVVHLPRGRGGWLRGDVLAIVNAEFIGSFDVAPRGHPNDGRVESLHCSSDLSLRRRFAVRSRLKLGTHLPHPQLHSRSIRAGEWTFERSMTVIVDGVDCGRTQQLAVEVVADAAFLYA
jgi:hypothetical protein